MKVYILSILYGVIQCLTVFCQGGYTKIVSKPSDPLIARSEDKATLNWTLELPPSETWSSSIFEVMFGIWKHPGFLKTKLLVIDRHGEVLIRPNYEKKISCDFNMSKLQVAFILHNLTMKDENHYCLQVELGLHQPPLTDPVMLLLKDPPKITSPKQENFSVNIGDNLRINSQAKGLPAPNITWTKQGRIVGNDTLVLNRVTPNDSGVYLCSAHNQAGEDHREIVVAVTEHNYGSQKLTVPHMPTQTSHDRGSPVWLFPVVMGVSVFLIAAVVIFRLRGRHCKRNLAYKQHIDEKASVFCQGGHPKIVSRPSDPLIARSEDKATLNWTLGLLPSETWNSSIFEVVFGIWKDPGFLKTKLLVIDRHGEVLIRPNYEKKISCDFNMSKLQVAFTLHGLTMKDENHYCLQVELGLHQPPLTDPVMLLLEDSPKITSPKQENFSVNVGDSLRINSQAKGLPAPTITWTKQGRTVGNDTLVLNGVTPNDSGVYLCSAHNQAGEDHKEIVVTVLEHNYGSQKLTVPHMPTQTSHDRGSPVWLFPVVIGVSVFLIAAVVVFRLRGHRCKRNLAYKQHTDEKASGEHSETAKI